MARLTKRTVDALRPAKADAFVWDDDLPGFGVRVKPSGAKSFLVQYRNRNGRSRRLTLGRYGIVTPDQAREDARQMLASVARGVDPAENRAIDRDAATMADLCRSYIEKMDAGLLITRRGKTKKQSTIYTDRGRIERHIIPLLGHRTIKDLTTADVRAFLRDVVSGKSKADVKTKARGRAIVTGGKGTGARTLGLLGGILSYAIEEGYRSDNPARGVVRAKDGKRRVRLDGDQYRELGLLIDVAEQGGEPWQVVMPMRLIALTGCRRGEVQKLCREEVDLAGQVLRLGDSKTGYSVRPIGREAVALLRAALKKSNEDFVFPSTRVHGKAFTGLPKGWERIVGGKLKGLTPHGLRHAFASTADDLGFTDPTIKVLIGHAASGQTQSYIHKADSALISAANKITGFIASAMDGTTADNNVVELKTA